MRYKEVLKKYGITQSELAERLGINRVSVSRLLSDDNDMRASTIIKIANAIGCSVSEMFEGYKGITKEDELTALIQHKGDFYKASTIKELEQIVEKIKREKGE